MAATAIVVAVAVAAVAYSTAHSDRSGSPTDRDVALAPKSNRVATPAPVAPEASRATGSPSATPANIGQLALGWAAANLARTTPLFAQDDIGAQLTARGFSAINGVPANAQYLIGQPAQLRTQLGDALYGRSVAVAQFGTSSAAVQVRSVLTVPADRVRSQLASDRANRVLAGSALSTNPQLSASADVRSVIRTGGLDLRAATFLALVASDIRVKLVSTPIDAAESAVSRPHRVLVIAASGATAAAIRAAARALPADYAPDEVGSDSSGSIVLTWSPSAQPVAAVT